MSPRAQTIWLEAYQVGYEQGIAAGRAQVEAEDAARWARIREQITAAARRPDYATLCERRGEHERAQRQRQILAERGVA